MHPPAKSYDFSMCGQKCSGWMWIAGNAVHLRDIIPVSQSNHYNSHVHVAQQIGWDRNGIVWSSINEHNKNTMHVWTADIKQVISCVIQWAAN